MNVCWSRLEIHEIKLENQLKMNIFLTTLSKIGKWMIAQAKLLVNSVNIALITITTKMTAIWGASTIKWRKVATVSDI